MRVCPCSTPYPSSQTSPRILCSGHKNRFLQPTTNPVLFVQARPSSTVHSSLVSNLCCCYWRFKSFCLIQPSETSGPCFLRVFLSAESLLLVRVWTLCPSEWNMSCCCYKPPQALFLDPVHVPLLWPLTPVTLLITDNCLDIYKLVCFVKTFFSSYIGVFLVHFLPQPVRAWRSEETFQMRRCSRNCISFNPPPPSLRTVS